MALVRKLIDLLGEDAVLSNTAETTVYEFDAYPLERSRPLAIVLPASTEEVAGVVRLCVEHNTAFAPRGAGTGLAGGTLCPEGILIGLSRMNKILEIDIRNRRIRAEAGVTNSDLTKAVSDSGHMYAPDPSSQAACTLGGNIANNAGGPHTLKYGVTVNHVLSVKYVTPEGDILTLGDATEDTNGYDLVGLMVGSEGTCGIVTEATVRIVKVPQSVMTFLAVFDTVDQATECVSSIISSGIVPAALEMMDAIILRTVEEAFSFGFPLDAGAILIVEIDGLAAGLPNSGAKIEQVFDQHSAREVRTAKTAKERARLWMARKKAIGTLGRTAPCCVTQDCVIPRSKLPEVLRSISEIGTKYNLKIANVFHAGDGNLHPAVLFDDRDADEVSRVIAASHDILTLCLSVGGTLSGEHGIGVEKRDFMPMLFSAETLTTMAGVRDAFNANGLCNPGKVLPTSHGCTYELGLRRGPIGV